MCKSSAIVMINSNFCLYFLHLMVYTRLKWFSKILQYSRVVEYCTFCSFNTGRKVQHFGKFSCEILEGLIIEYKNHKPEIYLSSEN